MNIPNFDPILFLDLNTLKTEDKKRIRNNLNQKISEFILIKIIAELPENKIKDEDNPAHLFALAKRTIPNLDSFIKKKLEEFKKIYQYKSKHE